MYDKLQQVLNVTHLDTKRRIANGSKMNCKLRGIASKDTHRLGVPERQQFNMCFTLFKRHNRMTVPYLSTNLRSITRGQIDVSANKTLNWLEASLRILRAICMKLVPIIRVLKTCKKSSCFDIAHGSTVELISIWAWPKIHTKFAISCIHFKYWETKQAAKIWTGKTGDYLLTTTYHLQVM